MKKKVIKIESFEKNIIESEKVFGGIGGPARDHACWGTVTGRPPLQDNGTASTGDWSDEGCCG